jgi:4-amino-4-deoxy-L-arabinose transferase-like glycosyltransferase
MGLWYAGCVIFGFIVIQTATPWGIGIRHDSLPYLTAAQSLAADGCLCRIGGGHELKPLVHFGPLYPILLWAVTLLSRDVLVSARWIGSVLYGLNLALWGGLVHHGTGRFWAGALVSTLLAASLVTLQVHDAAMSEPLFLAILAVGLLVLTRYLVSGERRWLYLAAAAVAAAVLTRYAAGSIILLAVASVLLLRRAPWKERLADAARLGIAASLPTALWMVRNQIAAGTATNRTLNWHPITIDHLRTFLQVVTAWFTPRTYSHWLEGAVLLALLVGAAAFLWGNRTNEWGRANRSAILGLLLVGVAGVYPAYVAISKSFLDDSIPVDDRMLAPMYVSLMALLGVIAALVGRYRRARWVLLPALALLLIGALPHMLGRTGDKLSSMRQDGVLFASRAWAESESMAWVRGLPEEAVVYSNRADIVQFLASRPVYLIPEGYDSVKAEARADFDDQLARMRRDLERPDSYLLVFDTARPMTPDDLDDVFKAGLRVVLVTEDGFVMARQTAGGEP